MKSFEEICEIGKAEGWKNILIASSDLINLPIEVFKLSNLKSLIIDTGGFKFSQDIHIIGNGFNFLVATEEFKKKFGEYGLEDEQIHFHPLPVKKLDNISSKIAILTELEYLWIFGNVESINSIPPEIRNLQKLEELRACYAL